MSLHDHDSNPTLDEIEAQAVTTVSAWLGQAEADINGQFGSAYAEKHPALLVGFLSSCAMVYAAERQVDVADRVRDGLLAIADTLSCRGVPPSPASAVNIEEALGRIAETCKRGVAILDTMAPPRFKGAPCRFNPDEPRQ